MIVYFNDIIWKVKNRNSSWTNWLLSFNGNLVRFRHVQSFMPLPLFYVLRSHVVVIQHLKRFFTHFLWGDIDTRSKIHWSRWLWVCYLIQEGGLGFRSFANLVENLELKLSWPFQDQRSLWASLMKAKY